MRTTFCKALLLPLVLLSLHSVSVCLADKCVFDQSFRYFDEDFKIATATQQKTGQDWEPIRIETSVEDLKGPLKYCLKNDGTISERDSKGADPKCINYYVTIPADQRKIVMSIIEKAIVLHTERLLVQRAVGPLVIPDFSNHPHCKFLNVPADHHTSGVANADMVLYVASDAYSSRYQSGLMGMTCAKSASGRPIAGILTIGYSDAEINRHTVRFTAHHIAHALGFSNSEMNSHKMIVDETVRGKPNQVAMVNSKKTKEMAQAHYGCATAKGMELEDGENNNKKTLSHWERRIAKDELMAEPVMGPINLFMGFYTSLTMAAFEDMGFYKANFTMAEEMIYGHKTGCKFLTDKCMENGVTEWPNMFCNAPQSNNIPSGCSTDRLRLGGCTLATSYRSYLPVYFRYFETSEKGGYDFLYTDYCPVFEADVEHFHCAYSEEQGKIPGSLYGTNAMCLDGSALKVKKDSGTIPMAAVCAAISCEGGSVKVKYHGDMTNKWHDCPEGQSLTPSLTSTSFVSGTIKCPKYKEVCTIAPDGSSLVPRVTYAPIEPLTNKSPSASQDPKVPQDPKASQDPKVQQDPKVSQKPTGQPNNPKSSGKSKDSSSVSFGLIPSVTFLVLSFAGYLIG